MKGKKTFWKLFHVERAQVRLVEHGEDADPDEHRSADQHQRELGRAILLAGGAPHADQQVQRHDREFVEEEEEEQVVGEERAVDAGKQRPVQDVEVLVAEIELPAGERSRERNHAGQQRHQPGDAVDRQVERDAVLAEEGRVFDPDPLEAHLCVRTIELIGGKDVDGEPGDDRARDGGDVADNHLLVARREYQDKRRQQRHRDGGEHDVALALVEGHAISPSPPDR
jgi:hypothetical protein